MTIERTFSIIKPDATERDITGNICSVLEKNGFVLEGVRKVQYSYEDQHVDGLLYGKIKKAGA